MVEYIVYDEELPSDEKELVKVLVTDEEKTLMEKLIKRIEQLSESATFLDNHDIISKLSELENIVKKNYEKIYDENYAALDKVNTSINSSRNEFSRKLDSIKNKIDESTDTETIEMKIDKMIELMAATQEVYRILGEKNIISMQDVTEKINIMVNGIQDLRTEIRQQMHSNQNYTSSLNEAVSKLNEDVMSFVEVTKSITAESIEKISDRIESMENKLSVTNLGEIETTLNKIVDALESLVSIRSVMEDFSPYFESMQKINEKMVSLIKEHYDIINARLSSMDETMLAYINSMNNKIDVPQSEEKIPSLINNIDEIK